MHETTGQPDRSRSAVSPDRRSPRDEGRGARSRQTDQLFADLSSPAGRPKSEPRPRCPEFQSRARVTSSDLRAAADHAPEALTPGRYRPQLQDRPVAVATRRGRHRSHLRGYLPSRPHVEDPLCRWGAARSQNVGKGAGRGRARTMAGRALAAYKKTLGAPVDRSCSWMKAASCCSPSSAGPGRLGGRRRSSGSGSAETNSRRSALTVAPHRRRFGLHWALYRHNIRSAEVFRFLFRPRTGICPTASPSSGIGIGRTGPPVWPLGCPSPSDPRRMASRLCA